VGYGLEDGLCIKFECQNQVGGCDICESLDTCHQCDDQFYLSNDKKSCSCNFFI